MRTLPLSLSASVALDSTGAGTASLGPSSSGETWQVASVGVHTSAAPGQTAIINESTCRVYAGAGPSGAYFADATTWGSTGDSTDAVTGTLHVGEQVWAVWTGGDAGATGYLVVKGTRSVA